MKNKIAIAGSGFSGAIIARELAEAGFKVSVFEERKHIAGNCYTERDPETGIMIHNYGPHIFNTCREDVWNYINKFDKFFAFTNRVKAKTAKGIFSLPINLLTINQFFNKSFNPKEAEYFINSIADKNILNPQNFAEQALKFIGLDLYKNFFYGYTKKQWGVEPTELPASILKRLPLRFNYDDNYYNQIYQGIPISGYTEIVKRILDHPNIELIFQKLTKKDKNQFNYLFYSGSIDAYFDYLHGKLNYRTLFFKKFIDIDDFQGNAVINYCEESVKFTRIAEHKHFSPWEKHDKTIYFEEYSSLAEKNDLPFYPMPLTRDKILFEQYIESAHQEENLSFIGRLGTYRYLDMHIVIAESIDLAKKCIELGKSSYHLWPKFSGNLC